MTRLIFLITLATLLSCESSIEVKLLEQIAQEIKTPPSVYSFDIPSTFYASSSDSFTIEMSYLSGDKDFQINELKLKSTNDINCELSIDDSDTLAPIVTLSNCTGDGRVYLLYGEVESRQVLISNNSGTPFVSGFDIKILKDGETALVAEKDRIYEVDLKSGVRTLIRSNSLGGGENVNNITSLFLSKNEDKIYVVDNSRDALSIIDRSTGFASFVSHSSRGSGRNLSNPNRVIINKNNTLGYVIDRGTHSILEIDLATGNRRELAPYVSVAYGIEFGQDENTIYFIERGHRILYEVDVLAETKTKISENLSGDTYNYSTPHAIVLDPTDSNYAYIINNGGNDTLFRVNLTSGEKSLIASKDKGSGPTLLTCLGIHISPDGKTVYAIDTDSTNEAIIAIDVSTGNRTFISK